MPEQDRAQLNNDTKAFTLFTNMLPADNSSQAKFLEAYDHMSTARTNIEQKYQGYDELQVLSHKIETRIVRSPRILVIKILFSMLKATK